MDNIDASVRECSKVSYKLTLMFSRHERKIHGFKLPTKNYENLWIKL